MNYQDNRSCGSSGTGRDLGARYRVSLTLDVIDAETLWSAAVSKGVVEHKLALKDVLDIVGRAGAPAIDACIMMLAVPARIAGCAVDDFWLDAIPVDLDRRADAAH